MRSRLVALLLLPQAARSLLWFNDAPNNLGDLDGLTTKGGVFYLRYNNGACSGGVGAAANAPCLKGAGGHCRMSIHSYGSATSPDGVHWTDHGTQLTEFDTGTACPKTGSGSGSVWKAYTNGTTEYVINFSEGGRIRLMTAPTPNGPWTATGGPASCTNGTDCTPRGFGPGVGDGKQWYNGRWDTANGWPAPPSSDPAAPKIYFWISATAVGANNTKQVGHASSLDGSNWTARPPAVVVRPRAVPATM